MNGRFPDSVTAPLAAGLGGLSLPAGTVLVRVLVDHARQLFDFGHLHWKGPERIAADAQHSLMAALNLAIAVQAADQLPKNAPADSVCDAVVHGARGLSDPADLGDFLSWCGEIAFDTYEAIGLAPKLCVQRVTHAVLRMMCASAPEGTNRLDTNLDTGLLLRVQEALQHPPPAPTWRDAAIATIATAHNEARGRSGGDLGETGRGVWVQPLRDSFGSLIAKVHIEDVVVTAEPAHRRERLEAVAGALNRRVPGPFAFVATADGVQLRSAFYLSAPVAPLSSLFASFAAANAKAAKLGAGDVQDSAAGPTPQPLDSAHPGAAGAIDQITGPLAHALAAVGGRSSDPRHGVWVLPGNHPGGELTSWVTVQQASHPLLGPGCWLTLRLDERALVDVDHSVANELNLREVGGWLIAHAIGAWALTGETLQWQTFMPVSCLAGLPDDQLDRAGQMLGWTVSSRLLEASRFLWQSGHVADVESDFEQLIGWRASQVIQRIDHLTAEDVKRIATYWAWRYGSSPDDYFASVGVAVRACQQAGLDDAITALSRRRLRPALARLWDVHGRVAHGGLSFDDWMDRNETGLDPWKVAFIALRAALRAVAGHEWLNPNDYATVINPWWSAIWAHDHHDLLTEMAARANPEAGALVRNAATLSKSQLDKLVEHGWNDFVAVAHERMVAPQLERPPLSKEQMAAAVSVFYDNTARWLDFDTLRLMESSPFDDFHQGAVTATLDASIRDMNLNDALIAPVAPHIVSAALHAVVSSQPAKSPGGRLVALWDDVALS